MKTLCMLFWSALILFSCKQTEIQVNGKAGELPYLFGENRIGMIESFNPTHPQATQDSMSTRWKEAVQAGMSVSRLQIDWPELEPRPNQYSKGELRRELQRMQEDSLQSFLLISAFDSEGPVLPPYLADKEIDDPEVIQGFKNLMDWVIPMMVEKDGFLISIVNEADNAFADNPALAAQILTFLTEIRDHIHSINPQFPVTVTFAEGNLDHSLQEITEIVNECDVACWNFYGAQSNTSSPYSIEMTEAEILADIERLLTVSGNKNLVIQELGMYSGNTELNSSEEIQRKFFEVFFGEMQRNSRIKAAFVFQLVDWSPELATTINEVLIDEGVDPAFVSEYSEALETIGLIRYSDGQSKKAWYEYIQWIKTFKK